MCRPFPTVRHILLHCPTNTADAEDTTSMTRTMDTWNMVLADVYHKKNTENMLPISAFLSDRLTERPCTDHPARPVCGSSLRLMGAESQPERPGNEGAICPKNQRTS
jgi:hypothetical protein